MFAELILRTWYHRRDSNPVLEVIYSSRAIAAYVFAVTGDIGGEGRI